MKKVFYPLIALAILAITVTSCGKDTDPSLETVTSTIVGSWVGDYPTGDAQLAFENRYGAAEQTLTFYDDGTYDMLRNDRTIVEKGTYVVSTETIILVEKEVTYLLEAMSDKKMWLEIDGDTYKYKKQ